MLKSTGLDIFNNTAKFLQAKEEWERFPTFWVAHSQKGEFESNPMRVVLDKTLFKKDNEIIPILKNYNEHWIKYLLDIKSILTDICAHFSPLRDSSPQK